MSINPKLLQTAKALRLKKGLSQNFLMDDVVIAAITHATVQDAPEGMPIVEIGSGGGFLTAELLKTGHPLTGIDVDGRMIRELTKRFGDFPQFRLIHQDVRQVDLVPLLAPRGRLVGNLPYHLTGPILFQLIGELDQQDYPLRRCMEWMILMVQKEVGERLTARPGETQYGQLSLHAQFWCQVETVLHVPRNAFYPSPKVDSVVLKLTPQNIPAYETDNLRGLSRLIKQAFIHRRKTLLNNLKMAQVADEAQLNAMFKALDLAVTLRPQDVSITQYGALNDALSA